MQQYTRSPLPHLIFFYQVVLPRSQWPIPKEELHELVAGAQVGFLLSYFHLILLGFTLKSHIISFGNSLTNIGDGINWENWCNNIESSAPHQPLAEENVANINFGFSGNSLHFQRPGWRVPPGSSRWHCLLSSLLRFGNSIHFHSTPIVTKRSQYSIITSATRKNTVQWTLFEFRTDFVTSVAIRATFAWKFTVSQVRSSVWCQQCLLAMITLVHILLYKNTK